MAITPMSALDAAWLLLESRDTPMHVGLLMEFSAPAGADPDYLRQWLERRREDQQLVPPFNLQLMRAPFGPALPLLREADDIDLSQHVHLWGLPRPGGQRELGILASALHSQPLDMRRPLWEMHVIDGLEENRFAMYFKIHHALIDGVSAMRHFARTFSTDPDDRDTPLIWAVPRPASSHAGASRSLPRTLAAPLVGLAGLARSSGRQLAGEADGRRAPYSVPRSPLGSQINGRRRLATQSYELAHLKGIAKAAGCSLNDLVLYLCGTALRTYLGELGMLPDKSLTAGVPVNLRKPGDERPGTAIGLVIVELGTDVADPKDRLAAVAESATAAKAHLRAMPDESLSMQSVLINAPYIGGLVAGLGRRSPIAFSLAISNVPGPTEPRYFNGAKLEGMYPISLLTHGNALNITCVSHDGRLDFGFTGAQDSLPHLQRLAVAMGAALDEIAELFSPA